MNRNNFLVENFIEVIIDSHTIVKNNREPMYYYPMSHLVSPIVIFCKTTVQYHVRI